MNYRFLILFLTLPFIHLNAQNNNTLFTVDNDKVGENEFVRVYQKNLELVKDENQKDIDAYLELFINYKLKIKEAKSLGLDQKQTYVNELKSYRNQLAKNYLTDATASDELIKEAYDRTLKEVNVDHILIRLEENASPEDTLKVYNQLLDLRKKLKKQSFDELRKELHDGKKVYVEQLGYFTAFDMVYPFETVAYNTKIGKVSLPFRTRFGYHILKSNGERVSSGKRTIAHIMLSLKNDNAENLINELHGKLKQGEPFSDLAKRFSDDKGTSKNGGRIEQLRRGKLSSKKFEDVAFGLANKNDFSNPFKTKYGWHIVQLIEKHPIKEFDEVREDLKSKVLKDTRSKKIGKALYDDIKKRYNFKMNANAQSFLVSKINESYFRSNWRMPQGDDLNETMFSFADKKVTYSDYMKFMKDRHAKGHVPQPIYKLVENTSDDFVKGELYTYHDGNLENVYEEFAVIMQEYRDGILLFDLMESKIWSTSKVDSLGLKSFYNKNKEKYSTKTKFKGIVVSVNSKKDATKAKKILEEVNSEETLKNTFNKDSKITAIVLKGTFEEGSDKVPVAYEFKKGVSEIIKSGNYYYVIKANEIIPPSIRDFEEIKGRVINDYQKQLETNWINGLKSKYKVSVDQDVLKKVKKRLK